MKRKIISNDDFYKEHGEYRDDFMYSNRSEPALSNRDVDMSRYEDRGFNESQLDEIYLGLNHGLDVSEVEIYADPKIGADEMWRIRNELEYDMEHHNSPRDTYDEYRESVSDYERGTTPFNE